MGRKLERYFREHGYRPAGGERNEGSGVASWQNRIDDLLEFLEPLLHRSPFGLFLKRGQCLRESAEQGNLTIFQPGHTPPYMLLGPPPCERRRDIIIWGEYGAELKLNVLDLRDDGKLKAREFTHAIDHATDVRFAVEALVDGVAPDPPRYLRSMQHDVAALSTLVDDLFLLTRIEAGQLDLPTDHIDLSELAEEAVEALQPAAAARSLDVRLDSSGAVPVDGNASAIGRVIRRAKNTATPKTEPVRRWHSRQWHTDTLVGSPTQSICTCPQAH